jgi:hypothetical protein
MKRISAALAVAALAVAAAPAAADRGAPGATFPEQPGAHLSAGCSAVLSNPGATTAPLSATAEAITTGLISDACFPD